MGKVSINRIKCDFIKNYATKQKKKTRGRIRSTKQRFEIKCEFSCWAK